MIPIRYKIRLQTIVSNILSYFYQLLGYISFKILSGILYLFLVVSERFYSYCYSHYNAYKNTSEYCRSNTYYLKNGYGKRIKIYRRSEFFDHKSINPQVAICSR